MKKARRVTGNDVTQAGGLIALIDKLVDQAKTASDGEGAASGMLHSLTGQPSGLDPKQTEPNAIIIARRRGILPLVTLVSEGSTGPRGCTSSRGPSPTLQKGSKSISSRSSRRAACRR